MECICYQIQFFINLHTQVIMKINKEELIRFYFYGWEISADEGDFPKWFEFSHEKIACLLGYNDQSFGIIKEEEEILTEVQKLIK